MPFFLHFMLDIIMDVKFEYINYYPEIYFFTVFISAYNLMCFNNKKRSLYKFGTILLVLIILILTISTCIYSVILLEQLVDLKLIINYFIKCASTF